VTGTVGGVALNEQDAFFASNLTTTTGTVLGITTFSSACDSLYVKKQYPRNSVGLSIQLAQYADSGLLGAVTAPGVFTLTGTNPGSGGWFGAYWDAADGACMSTSTQATGGTVTVTAVSTSELTGTFDLTFGTDHIVGSFNASDCPAAEVAQGDPTCI
jgi:hypothetical protein